MELEEFHVGNLSSGVVSQGYAVSGSDLGVSSIFIQLPGTPRSQDKKTAAEDFAEIFKTFGQAMSEVFNDPELKKKAKEFAESAIESAKTLGSRFKDEDVKQKFRDVGKAAEDFGKNISDCFKKDKE